jgi:branched-chain amino acid transport system permease protein
MQLNRSFISILVLGALLATVPWMGLSAFWLSFLYLILYWSVLTLSWNVFSGYSGYFSFGHGAFFGIGIYTVAYMCGQLERSFLPMVILGGALSGVAGVLLGALVFRVKRVRGELFALLTLAVTFIISTIVLNTPIDGGPGVYLNSVEIPKLGPNSSASFFLLMLALFVVSLLISKGVGVSKLGAALFAIHDDEDAAEVMGVPTFKTKLIALFISACLAGVAGGIHAVFVSYVTANEVFSINVPLFVVLMSILGGSRHWAGPAIGAIAITSLQYVFTIGDNALLGKMALGVILILVILFKPDGFLGALAKKSVKAQAKRIADSFGVSLESVHTQTQTHFHVDHHHAHHHEHHPHKEQGLDSQGHWHGKDQILLEAKDLCMAFSGLKVLQSLNLEIYSGEILGLLGPNGSGKSTFINVVSGHYKSTGGQLIFNGKDITHLKAHEIAQQGIARTYQIPRPFANLTVFENTRLVAAYSRGLSLAEATAFAIEALEKVGLDSKIDSLPQDLNLHQRKFLEFARALAAKPKLLMLDEVLSGLTPSEIQSAINLILSIKAQGTTILFVEHVMSAVMALADRVAVINHGQLLAKGDPQVVMTDPQVITAYLGKKLENA